MKKLFQILPFLVCFITLSGALAPARINLAEIENLPLHSFLILYNVDNLPYIGQVLDHLNAEYKEKQARFSPIKTLMSVIVPVELLAYIFYPPEFDSLYHVKKTLAKTISIIVPTTIIMLMFITRKTEADEAKRSLEYVSKGLAIAIEDFQDKLERVNNPVTAFTVILDTCAQLKGTKQRDMPEEQLKNRLINQALGAYEENPNRYQTTPSKMEIWQQAYQAITNWHEKNDEAVTQEIQAMSQPRPREE